MAVAAWIAGRTFFPMDMMEVKRPPSPAMEVGGFDEGFCFGFCFL